MGAFGEAALKKALKAAEEARLDDRHVSGPPDVAIACKVIDLVSEIDRAKLTPRSAAYLRSLVEISRQRIAEDARRETIGG